MAAGAVVTGVSVGDAGVWEVTGSPSELTGVRESPPEADAALGAAALAADTCATIRLLFDDQHRCYTPQICKGDVSHTAHAVNCTPAGCPDYLSALSKPTLAALGAGALAAAAFAADAGAAGSPLLLTGVSESPELDTGVKDSPEPDAGAAGASGAAGESVESEEEALCTV